MENKVKKHFDSVFKLLLETDKIVIPDKTTVKQWDNLVTEWTEDPSMTLFARKGGQTRGMLVTNPYNRKVITTDNTPAHWVFKNVVFEKEKFKKQNIRKLIESNKFPISFVRKRSEYATLLDGMVADKYTRLNNQGWKLAHIRPIALKRGNNIDINDYKNHHFSFLALSNMYLIDKKFSGLAEVELFNSIVTDHIAGLS